MALITVPGILLPDSEAEAYVCPSDTRTNRVNLTFTNNHSASVQVEVWIVPNGESVGDEFMVIGMESAATILKVGETRIYPLSQTLLPGDKIFWVAATAAVISAKLDISEVEAAGITIDGFTRAYEANDDNTVYLPNALGVAYTVPDGGQIVQAEALLHNINAAAQTFTIKAVPPSEDAGDDDWIISRGAAQWELAPGETRLIQLEHFLTAGYTVQWIAETASAVVGRLSFERIEF